MTIASTSSARSRRYEKSGRTRSTPGISAVGKRRPQSTTTIRSSYSKTVMFLPISPSPPSGRTRSVPLLALRLVERDERKPRPAHAVAAQLERRLDDHRGLVPGERLVERLQA